MVLMGRDRRTYRFVKDTRLGRTVMLETADLDDMADCVTQYVAERIIERERALEADWLADRILRAEEPAPKADKRSRLLRAVSDPAKAEAPSARIHPGWIVSAFLGGLLVGVAALVAYAWVHIG